MLYIEYYPEFRYNKEQGQAEDPVAKSVPLKYLARMTGGNNV